MNTILLYQMGKVGSTSMQHALHNRGIKSKHAHWMMGDFPDSEFPTTKPALVENIRSGKTPPLKVIVPIREPVSRNLSAFTFNLIKYGVTGRQETVEELKELFLKEYDIYYPQRWFETELMSLFSFNPFEIKFKHSKGYQIYTVGKHEILIIRLEDADKVFSKAIRKFLGVWNVRMIHSNSLETKKYIGEKYKLLKQSKFTTEFLEEIYSMKYVQHFYTPKEIEAFKKERLNGEQ